MITVKKILISVRLICLLIRSLCFAEIDWHTASSTAANQHSQINVQANIPPTAPVQSGEWVRWSADADAWSLQMTYSFLYCMGVVRLCKKTTHSHIRKTNHWLWWQINGLLPYIKHLLSSLSPDTLWRVSNLTNNLLKWDCTITANSLFHGPSSRMKLAAGL